jgi:hypothetical protein
MVCCCKVTGRHWCWGDYLVKLGRVLKNKNLVRSKKKNLMIKKKYMKMTSFWAKIEIWAEVTCFLEKESD